MQPEPPRTIDGPPELQPQDQRKRWIKLGLLAAVLLASLIVGRATGLTEQLTTENLRATLERAGAWGVALFVLAFVVGELIHIPGLVFVAAAVAGYGRVAGGSLSLVAAVISVAATFLIVRAVGGRALSEIRSPLVRRLLRPLDTHPIRTVVVLRTLLFLSPQLNYALALSSVRFRDYLAGSAIGLVGPMLAAVFVFDKLLV